MSGILERFVSAREHRRMRVAARAFLLKHGGDKGLAIIENDYWFDEFCDQCLDEQAKSATGPLADVFAALIQSFIDNPEKWLRVILLVIQLFASEDDGA